MDVAARIEEALTQAVARAGGENCPPKLSQALHHAVFPGGARVRPTLCLAVASACGDPDPEVSTAAAAALELLHCASLVHDDLPCFDDADIRRGKPSVHQAFGEPIAVLAGDALIVLAFETLTLGAVAQPARMAPLMQTICGAVGGPTGIVAGQAWESEVNPPLDTYHRAKTGALFVGATLAGAQAAGRDPNPWRLVGELIGEAYQVADDLLDAIADSDEAGKPVGQDSAHERPNAVLALGLPGAVGHLENLVAEAVRSIPDVPGADALRGLVAMQAKRLVPKTLASFAA
ncbi:MAG: polyprenyl synthetase family protein [Pseudomonadota bacterium]